MTYTFIRRWVNPRALLTKPLSYDNFQLYIWIFMFFKTGYYFVRILFKTPTQAHTTFRGIASSTGTYEIWVQPVIPTVVVNETLISHPSDLSLLFIGPDQEINA